MKFDFVIGNPPFQENLEGTSKFAPSVFNDFMDSAYTVADKVVLITPAKFLFNGGNTPKAWNQKMLDDEHFKVLMYEPDARKVFPSQSFMGGVAIHYRDSKKIFGAIKQFSANSIIGDIVNKIVNADDFTTIRSQIHIQNSFDLERLFMDFPDAKTLVDGKDRRIRPYYLETMGFLFTENKRNEDDVRICGLINRKREYRYLSRKYLANLDESNIDSYKVLMSAADGASGTMGNPIPARITGVPCVEEKGVGYSKTFFSIGSFADRQDAENLRKYICTRFTRFMVGTVKSTNALKDAVWVNVPMQDFSSSSDIDWSKTIPQIDQQLYRKYGLTDEEIAFIETHVKEMT